MHSTIRGLILACLLGFLVACSLEPGGAGRRVLIQIGGSNANSYVQAAPHPVAIPSSSPSPAPSTLADFDCIGINVTGPGIPDSSRNPTRADLGVLFGQLVNRASYCSYRGILGGPLKTSMTAPQEIALVIPPGQRLVQVVGLKERNGSTDCQLEFTGAPKPVDAAGNALEADAYEIGRALLNLTQDQAVSISSEWDGLPASEREFRRLNCKDDGPNPGPTPPPIVQVLTPTALSGATNPTKIAMSTTHVCILESSQVKCKGSNTAGQLGNGTTVDSGTFVTAVTNATDVSVSDGSTCALTTSNTVVQCWGKGGSGQLGNGATGDSSAPVTVSGLTGTFSKIAVGTQHACALASSGSVYCWGDNTYGQLGDGTNANHTAAALVSGITATSIAAGANHTCAILNDMSVKCWGQNSNGQVGDGTTTNRNSPATSTGISSASAISAGLGHTCALAGSQVRCWGRNDYGQVGDGSVMDRLSPTAITVGISGPTYLSAGVTQTCVGSSSGQVQCWGDGLYGQLGNGGTAGSNTPVNVSGTFSGMSGLSSSAAAMGTCAIMSAGPKCWGANDSGVIIPQ